MVTLTMMMEMMMGNGDGYGYGNTDDGGCGNTDDYGYGNTDDDDDDDFGVTSEMVLESRARHCPSATRHVWMCPFMCLCLCVYM